MCNCGGVTPQGMLKFQFTSPSGEVTVFDTLVDAKIAQSANGGMIQKIYIK